MTKWVGFITLFFFCLGKTTHAQMMYVKEKSGATTILTRQDIRKLIFPDGNMTVISYAGNSDSFTLTKIRYINFTDLSTDIYPLAMKNPQLLTLFPNPVQDILTLNLNASGKTIQIDVMTLDGKIVLRKVFSIQPGINQVIINVSLLPEGMYLCRFIDGTAAMTGKFIKD